jgi:hypothetical protein
MSTADAEHFAEVAAGYAELFPFYDGKHAFDEPPDGGVQ